MGHDKQIQIDDIFACIYYLNDGVEVHYGCKKETYVKAAIKLLKYLDQEAFITTESVKLIPVPLIGKNIEHD
tara:strand:- start:338 stop:553 length:216 start_codon:yes stop_codon:yes gene_type:complete